MLLSSKKLGFNSSNEGHITLCVMDLSLIFIALEKKLLISYRLLWVFELLLLIPFFPFDLLGMVFLSIFFFLELMAKLTNSNMFNKYII